MTINSRFEVNGEIMTREELEQFMIEYIKDNNLEGKLRNLLSRYTLEQNVAYSAVRLARECGFSVRNVEPDLGAELMEYKANMMERFYYDPFEI